VTRLLWVHIGTAANSTHYTHTHCPLGATIVGKTHMSELAYSLDGSNAHYGTPANAAAPGRNTGGSSSGSAVRGAVCVCCVLCVVCCVLCVCVCVCVRTQAALLQAACAAAAAPAVRQQAQPAHRVHRVCVCMCVRHAAMHPSLAFAGRGGGRAGRHWPWQRHWRLRARASQLLWPVWHAAHVGARVAGTRLPAGAVVRHRRLVRRAARAAAACRTHAALLVLARALP
jgi:Asp-tRNA(Asn)/Glu-tRNA(Gln) amidotransferase A subunit family amidase